MTNLAHWFQRYLVIMTSSLRMQLNILFCAQITQICFALPQNCLQYKCLLMALHWCPFCSSCLILMLQSPGMMEGFNEYMKDSVCLYAFSDWQFFLLSQLLYSIPLPLLLTLLTLPSIKFFPLHFIFLSSSLTSSWFCYHCKRTRRYKKVFRAQS